MTCGRIKFRKKHVADLLRLLLLHLQIFSLIRSQAAAEKRLLDRIYNTVYKVFKRLNNVFSLSSSAVEIGKNLINIRTNVLYPRFYCGKIFTENPRSGL